MYGKNFYVEQILIKFDCWNFIEIFYDRVNIFI